MKITQEFTIKDMMLKNRLVMAPMCTYQSLNNDGMANDFHFAHYVSRAIGQVGLIIVEATGVSANGRIADTDLGLYNDQQIEPLKRIVDAIHQQGSKVAIQLNHAGRKSKTKNLKHVGPSICESNMKLMEYEELTKEEIQTIINDFKAASTRALKAGFDAIEIHGAHGYLIHQFLSPLSNQRKDEYGQDRTLFLKQLLAAIHSVWPHERPLWIRVSATDYHADGLNIQNTIEILNEIKTEIDAVHVSSGGNILADIPLHTGYQLNLSKAIKEEVGLPTIGVGLLKTPADFINALEDNTCDLVASARQILRNPQLMFDILEVLNQKEKIHTSYQRAY